MAKRRLHLNKIPAKVHLKGGKLSIIVDIPWTALGRRTIVKKKIHRKK